MATITGLTAERMQEIIDATIVDADVIGDNLILTKDDGSTIDAGNVRGNAGIGKGAAFPPAPTDGDLWVRTDQARDPLYKFTDGVWTPAGGGLDKVTAFPGAPTDGDVVIRTDQSGDPMYKFTDGVWELQPRMGALTVPSCSVSGAMSAATAPSTWRQLTIDTVSFDTNAMADIAGDTVVIKTPGLYMVEARAVDNGVSTVGSRWLSLDLNGAGNGSNAIETKKASDGGGTRLGSTIVRRYAAGDVLRVSWWQNSDVNMTAQLLELAVTWIGGAGQNIDERGVPAALAKRTTALAIPNGVETVVPFDTSSRDTDGMWAVAAPTRMTVKTPGLYRIDAFLHWQTNSSGYREILVRKNGSIAFVSDWAPSSSAVYQHASDTILLAAGDYVELNAYQNSGGASSVGGASTQDYASPHLSLTLIASGKTVTPFAKVYKTASSQTVPDTGTDTALSFDAEEADNDGIHDTVTNNTRLTCRTAGVYHVRGLVGMAAGATAGTRWINLRKNGTTLIEQIIEEANDNATLRDTQKEITTTVELAVGDYLELTLSVVEAGAGVLVSGSATGTGRGTKFSMIKIGAPNTGAAVTPGQADVYTVATLPAATAFPNGRIVGVSDGAAGQQARMAMNGAWLNLG